MLKEKCFIIKAHTGALSRIPDLKAHGVLVSHVLSVSVSMVL